MMNDSVENTSLPLLCLVRPNLLHREVKHNRTSAKDACQTEQSGSVLSSPALRVGWHGVFTVEVKVVVFVLVRLSCQRLMRMRLPIGREVD